MGTGYTIDSPIRVAPFGIDSVVSLVDDILIGQIHEHYANLNHREYTPIPRNAPDGRSERIRQYLDLAQELIHEKIDQIKAMPFFEKNDKHKYFRLLPDSSPLKQLWNELQSCADESRKAQLQQELNAKIEAGDINVNIMVKLDALQYPELGDDYSDAKLALKGFATSKAKGNIVFSAGINQRLFAYMTRFKDFYRDATGDIKKGIILKVSDFRSAMTQGRFMARKGLEVCEFRIESGLNCGGHAFPSDGELLPSLLREFTRKRDELFVQFKGDIQKYYKKQGWQTDVLEKMTPPRITVQGGIGSYAEAQRLHQEYGMDATGWGSPFLLVPEVSPTDENLRKELAAAGPNDLYLSHNTSPIGVAFNNLRRSPSERNREERLASGRPGSPCPKKFLVSNTEYTEQAICTASLQFLKKKLPELEAMPPGPQKDLLLTRYKEKSCICHELGNSALIHLGTAKPEKVAQAVCPGPNVAWFIRDYTLEEMVDHIYGRSQSLVPAQRPHMFAKEIQMYMDYLEHLAALPAEESKGAEFMQKFAQNMQEGLDYAEQIAQGVVYGDENIASIQTTVEDARRRLKSLQLL
jgi:hypothetical protein